MRDRKNERRRRAGGLACAVLGFCLTVGPVVSQDITGGPASPPIAASAYRLPSEKTAFTLSLVGSLVPVGLTALMAMVQSSDEDFGIPGLDVAIGLTLAAGSSAGFFYGGLWGRGLLMSGLRLGASILVVYYAMYYDERDNTWLGVAWLAGMAGSIIFDLATVKSAVRKHNRARLAERGLNIAVSPFALPKGAGVQLRLSF